MPRTRADRAERTDDSDDLFPDAEEQERRDEDRRRELTALADIATGGRAGEELLPGSEAQKAKRDEAERGRREREKAEKR